MINSYTFHVFIIGFVIVIIPHHHGAIYHPFPYFKYFQVICYFWNDTIEHSWYKLYVNEMQLNGGVLHISNRIWYKNGIDCVIVSVLALIGSKQRILNWNQDNVSGWGGMSILDPWYRRKCWWVGAMQQSLTHSYIKVWKRFKKNVFPIHIWAYLYMNDRL